MGTMDPEPLPQTFPVKQTAKAIGKRPNTLRTWSGEDLFGPYLSEYANPPKGQERRFTEEDIAILKTAVFFQSQGLELKEIVQRIAQGEIVLELPFSEEPGSPGEPSSESQAQIPASRALAPTELLDRIALFLKPYEDQIKRLSQDLDRERGELKEERERLKEEREKLEEEKARRTALELELERLKAQAEERSRSFWDRLLGR